MPDNYGDVSQWEPVGSEVAGPRGLSYQREQAQQAAGGNPYGSLGAWTVQEGLTGAARGWYSGRYVMGQSNGWETGFMAETVKQYEEQQQAAAESGDFSKFYDWFDREDATGVVTWNDEEKGLKVGDVYNNGDKVGNLYADFDEKTANLMLAEHVLDKETKQHIFSDMDRDRLLADEITAVVDANTTLRTDSEAHQAFKVAVEQRKSDITSSWGDEALVGGTTVGGGLTGAGVGTMILPGPGTLIGGGVGLGLGFLGGMLNKDLLTEQTARAIEISSIANSKYGGMEAALTGVKEFSGVGLKMLQPFSNLVQGTYDWQAGEIGDGKSEFYAVDDDGERRVGGVWRAADLAATLADSIGTFGTKAAAGAYMGLTGGHVTGQVGMMGLTGAGWNDRSASFDEYEGAQENLAAIGTVGIDLVQMGFAGALLRGGAVSRSQAGGMRFADDAAVAGPSWRTRMPSWVPGAQVEGARTQTIAGMKFWVDDAGTAVAARPSISMLAPSEMIRWMPISAKTRWRAAASGKELGGTGAARLAPKWAVSPDDFYRTARETAMGQSRFAAAVVNGWAEGAEEGVQAVLEPMSFSAEIRAGQVFEQFFYGMASGAGMSLGALSRPATSEAMEKARAAAVYEMRHATPMTDEVWDAMSTADRAKLRALDPAEEQSIKQLMNAMQEAQVIDRGTGKESVVGSWAMRDLRSSKIARDLANANPNNENVLVLGGMGSDKVIAPTGEMDEDLFDAHASITSAWQAMRNLTDLHLGMRTHVLVDLPRRIAEATAQLDRATAGGVAEEIDAANQLLAEYRAEQEDMAGQVEVNDTVLSELARIYNAYAAATDAATAEGWIDEFNAFVKRAWNAEMVDEAGVPLDPKIQQLARRSVEIMFARHPIMTKGSFVMLMPQVSKALSKANAHGFTLTHQSILKSMGADRDGDTLVTNNFKYVPPAQKELLRAGAQFVKDNADEPGAFEVVVDPPDGEPEFITHVSEALGSGNEAIRSTANFHMMALEAELYARYENLLDPASLVELLLKFRTQVADGNSEARMNLVNGLFRLDRNAMINSGRDNKVMEMPWLQQRITKAWQAVEVAMAANDETLGFTPAQMGANVDLPAEMAFHKGLAVEEAATEGHTMDIVAHGAQPVRQAQKLHYSVYRNAIDPIWESEFIPERLQELIEGFAAMSSGLHQSKLDTVRGRDNIQKRVVYWLTQMARESEQADVPLLLLANTRVADFRVGKDGNWEQHDVSLLQMLLDKSLDIEEREHAATAATDEAFAKKIRQLRRLSSRDPNVSPEKSTTAQQAMLEVFGSMQIDELLGNDAAKYLGPERTMNQLVDYLTNMNPEARQQQLYRWRRKAPYALGTRLGNPPYYSSEVSSAEVTSYRMAVDAISVGTTAAHRKFKDQDAAAHKNFISAITDLQAMVKQHRISQGRTLAGADEVTVLRHMLAQNPRTVAKLGAIFPDAARLGIFDEVGGQVFQARWVDEMLTASPERAAVIYIVQTKLAEWNALGGNLDETGKPRDPDGKATLPRQYSQLRSRMLQTFYRAAQDGSGVTMLRLLRVMNEANTVEQMMDAINDEPGWIGDRADLLAFVDDVALFESDPSQVWTANLPGTLQREALADFAQHTRQMTESMVLEETERVNERNAINHMLAYLESGRVHDVDGASTLLGYLELAISNRFTVPDHLGPKARDALHAKVQSGVLKIQEKGKADPAASPAGEQLVLVNEFGVKQSVFQAVDAVTVYDVADILANPTKLADGPVRVGMADGSVVTVDFTDPYNVLLALQNPATNAFAKMVLFPTARDVNQAGVLQAYLDVGRADNPRLPGFVTMLRQQNFAELFVPQGGRLAPWQAHKYISMLEARISKAALTGTEDEQARAYFPISTIINEVLVAYSHRAGASTLSQFQLDKIREDVYVDVAMAIQSMAALGSAELVRAVEVSVKASMKQRFLLDNSATNAILESKTDQVIENVLVIDTAYQVYRQRRDALHSRLSDDTIDQMQRDQLNEEIRILDERMEARVDALEALRSTDTVQAAINMYSLTGDRDGDALRKVAIYRAVSNYNKLDKYNIDYRLVDKVNWMVAHHGAFGLGGNKITDAEWQQLGAVAATVYLSELSGRSGSSVNMSPIILGREGEQQRRYFDKSWGYLIDGLLNPQLLTAARDIARQALYSPDLTTEQVAGQLQGGLLNRDKLGTHTDLIIAESMKGQHVLATAAVGLAIPVAGVLPPEVAAYAGASRRTGRPPRPPESALTPHASTWDRTTGLIPLSDEQVFKLNHAFAGRAIVKAAGLPPEGVDILARIGEQWHGDDSVRDSGYLMIRVDKLIDAMDEITASAEYAGGPLEVEIDYFDVDTKPFDRANINSVYYDGAGRSGSVPIEPGLIAEMVNDVDAINQRGQQNPLDMATKKGQGYKPTPVIGLDAASRIEASGASVAEVLRAKAELLVEKEYDTGKLHPADVRSLYKLLQMRHVVVGRDAEGQKKVIWAAEAISGLELTDPVLVPLSEAQAQTLLGEPGDRGLPGAFTPAKLNLADIDAFPSLDNARLEQLGLTRLGETTTLEASEFAGLVLPPKLSAVTRTDSARVTQYEKAIEQYQYRQEPVLRSRVSLGRTEFDRDKINKRNARAMDKMLGAEGLAPLLGRMNIPFTGLRDMGEQKLTRQLLKRLERLKEVDTTSVLWLHSEVGAGTVADGVIKKINVDEQFAGMAWGTPVYRDIVTFDMDDFLTASGGDMNKAYDRAKVTLRTYSKQGVSFFLASTSGSNQLRTMLKEWLDEGGLGYAASADSAHFYMPINPRQATNQTRAALDSTLTATQYFRGNDSIILTLMSDFFDGVEENASFWDLRPEQPVWRSESLTQLPTVLGGMWGLPVKGIGKGDQRGEMREVLLKFLRSPQGVAHLKRLGGDPAGVPVYKVRNPGTENEIIEPGIRDLDSAIKRLADMLEANPDSYPTEVGETIMHGDIIPLRGPNGSILLTRVGFQLPDATRMAEMLDTPVGNGKPVNGESPARIAIAIPELQEGWTVRPPGEIQSVAADHNGGLTLNVRYNLSRYGKSISEGEGWKTLYSPMPNWLEPPRVALGSNGLRFNAYTGRKARESKEATLGATNNFKWLFALGGIDFRRDMVELLMGPADRDGDQLETDWNSVKIFLDAIAANKPGWTASQIATMLDDGSFLALFAAQLDEYAQQAFGRSFTYPGLDKPYGKADPQARLGQIIMASLMAPRLQVKHVIGSVGLMNLSDMQNGAQVQLLPDLLTDALNSSDYPELREMLIDRVNARMPIDPQLGMPAYQFDYQLNMRVAMRDRRHVPGAAELPFNPGDNRADRQEFWRWKTEGSRRHGGQGPASTIYEEVAAGLTRPVLVKRATEPGGKPTLMDGHHRVAAAMDQGLATVPAVYEDGTPFQLPIQPLASSGVLWVTGLPAISLEYAADENPVNYVQARVRSARQGESQHVAFESFETISGRTITEREVPRLFGTENVTRFDEDSDTGGFWQMMMAVPRQDNTYQPWKQRNPAQRLWTKLAYAKYKAYIEPVSTTEWTDTEKVKVDKYKARFLTALNLEHEPRYAVELDYLVRQFLGARGRVADEPPGVDEMTAEAYIQAAELIMQNIGNKMNPLQGGIVPLPSESFLKIVYDANQGVRNPWAPKTTTKKKFELATDYDQWIKAIVGHMRESMDQFYTVYRQDLDGFWQTYESASADLTGLPISLDNLIDVKLMGEEINDALVSLDPNQRAILSNPIVFESAVMNLEALAGEGTVFNRESARDSTASPLADRIARIQAWHRKTDLPKDEKRSHRSYVTEGSWYIHGNRDTHNFLHSMVNLSVGMRLLNPAIWVSAMIEVPIRSTLEELTDVVMGQATGMGRALNVSRKYTKEEIDLIRQLADDLGNDDRFLAEIYDELMYQFLVERGRGKIGTGIEKFARFSARATADPTFGMTAKSVALRYIGAALSHLEASNTPVDIRSFVAEMNRNGLYLRNAFDSRAGGMARSRVSLAVNPHQAGLNRVAQIRAVKATVPSKALMGTIDTMTTSSNGFINFTGHLLKIPFLFTRFNSGAFITLSGMGGFDQMAAMMLHGRESKFLGRLQAGIKGEQYDPDVHGYLDMSDVLEGMDLTRPFVRGAITHTGLMALGMMASGLNLTGEDEEAKRRRKLAEYLRAPLMYDPREDSSDFRNADQMYLEFLPGEMETFFGVSAMDTNGTVSKGDDSPITRVQPHWILNQFVSPVMGMERFFETGDVRQIQWGFRDAIAVLPHSAVRLWDEARLTADMMQLMAKEASIEGTPGADYNTNRFLVTLVSIYEKALVESSFVNAIRNGMDEYDRNPWVLPELKAGTEEIKFDKTGQPLPTTALTEERDPETGEVSTHYTGRSDWSALLHGYAENNTTAAMMLSLFTGQWNMDSTYFRQNMVPKETKIKLPMTQKDAAEALILAALREQGSFESITAEELVRARRQMIIDAGGNWNEAELQEWGERKAKEYGMTDLVNVLADGSEVLSKEGAGSVLLGLQAGTVELGDAALRGMFIPFEMREQLEEEWITELVQEGVDMGFDEMTAKARAKRLWYGNTFEDPSSTGLRDILWSDKIPWSASVKYRQLNTTFMLGPDGLPWATGVERGNLWQALGIPPLPYKTIPPADGGLTVDARGNTVDPLVNINTGGRALERVEENWKIEPNNKGFDKAMAKAYEPGKKTDSVFSPYSRRGYGGYGYSSGGGGGYSSGGYANFRSMYQLPDLTTPYGNQLQFVNTSNPILRRASIRRERVWSERGRLKQWQ